MTIDIANRLVELRKRNGLSQEQLAEKLGLSRQAISKWERAEASPDTDNLIMLSRLYGVSLDELLNSDAEDEEFIRDKGGEAEKAEDTEKRSFRDSVHIGRGGIHVEAKNGDSVHVGWDGIHVNDKSGTKVDVGPDGVYVDDGYSYYDGKYGKVTINGVEYSKSELRKKYRWLGTIFNVLVVAAYLLIGVFTNVWHPTWMLFLLIPIVSSFFMAIVYRDIYTFAFPVLVTLAYLVLGFFYKAWHPGWVVFLAIPIYYTILPKKDWHLEADDEDDDED
jgi:HTH-type transcriptional regulator/antitoxin HipB